MRDDFLLTVTGHNTFREVELPSGVEAIRVGTLPRDEVRYRSDLFFSPFELEFSRLDDSTWSVACSEEVYLSADGVQRLTYAKMRHADTLSLKYSDSSATLVTIRLSIDFERRRGAYDRCIDLGRVPALTIGGLPNCNLVLSGPYASDALLVVEERGAGSYWLSERRSRYGVMLDGKRLEGPARLGNMTFFSVADSYFYYRDGRLYFSGSAGITGNDVAILSCVDLPSSTAYPLFNRNTRVREVCPEGAIAVLDPPAKQEERRQSIVIQLLPAVGMLAITVLIRGQMAGDSSSGMLMMLMSVATVSLGVLTSVAGIVSERRRFKQEAAARIEGYNAYIQKKRGEIEAARSHELAALRSLYPGPSQELGLARDFSSDLFDRRVADDDFLVLRLGVGKRKTRQPLDAREKEMLVLDELAQVPLRLADEYAEIDDAPITVDLKEVGALGVAGPSPRLYEFLRTLVVDVCSRQYESDCKVYIVVEPEHAGQVAWARLLPHVQNEELGARNIACDPESRNIVFEHLYKLLTARQESGQRDVPEDWERIVVFVLDECGIKNHPLSRFVDKATGLGCAFVFFEPETSLLPLGCGRIARLEGPDAQGELIDPADAASRTGFSYEPVSLEDAESFARTLAPVYCEEISLESSLTGSITMFQMLGIISADDLDLVARWAQSDVCRSLAAPIGVSKSRMVTLDLHDKADGPHGLVAGTTGSGKSEVLQTYILSVATLFHPYEVAFVIIDFKGGGMANQLRDLPHLAGAITNIDGREIERSLKSIKAELKRRQRLFAEAEVNHISDYIRRHKAGKAPTPLPHLVIVVDEFAELKADQPEFMAELISAARIGRSLGVHLILATQKPSGQVNEQIWSNSRFKLCLKVQSREDSNEVLKSPLAAEIKEPGRAYLQVGNNETFELFQSAYSGGPERVDDDGAHEFSLFEVSLSGKRTPIYQRRRARSSAGSLSQLDAIVGHIDAYCAEEGIERLPSICLAPLPELIQMPKEQPAPSGKVALGVYDDPDNQYQGEALFDLDGGNTFILGSAQTGKTNLLQVIIRSVSQAHTPDEACFYVMDFASMTLKNFERLAHVGGVVLPSEDEKLKNLFKLLADELAQRKKRLLEVGVSSFAAYVEAGYSDLPHIYLLLDNFAVFRELYADRYDDAFIPLCRDGIAYGVSVVMTNSSTSGFGYKYMSNFSNFIALPCNDAGEYATLFNRCRMEPKPVPGRALIAIGKRVVEMQSYRCFEGAREIDRLEAIADFIELQNGRAAGAHARRIPCVPDDLDRAYIYDNYRIAAHEVPIALDYGTVGPVCIDLDSCFSFAMVAKDAKRGERTARVLLEDIRENIFERACEVFIVDGLDRSLADWSGVPFVEGYYTDPAGVGTVIDRIRPVLEERRERVAELGMEAIADEPYLVAIVNSAEALDYLSSSGDLVESYTAIKKQLSAMRVLFVFSAVPDVAAGYAAPAMLKQIKEEQRGLMLTNLGEHKFYDVNGAAARAFKGSLEDGQAYYVNGTDLSKVRVPAAGKVD